MPPRCVIITTSKDNNHTGVSNMNTLEKIRVLEAKRDSSRANKAAGAQAESVAKDYQKIINMLRASL